MGKEHSGSQVENKEKLDIKIEYSYTGPYKNILASHEGTSFELVDPPREATEFDGYIETSIGNFAIQEGIEKARKAIASIKDYVAQTPDIQREIADIDAEILKQKRIKETAGPTSLNGDFEEYSAAGEAIGNLEEQRRVLVWKVSALEVSVKLYKL